MTKSFEAAGMDYEKSMIERSLVYPGNSARIRHSIKKAAHGETVTIAYLGGSITEQKKNTAQEGYALLSYRDFCERYGSGNNVKLLNAGMNGTSSAIGLLRLERDVLRYQPDIIFVEFAVNDAKDDIHREAFECLIRKLLLLKSEPAVILLFMQSETGYSCQGQMQAVGEYYNLPMISICEAIQPEIAAGRMSWNDYAADNIHPHQEGHRLIERLIKHYFDYVEAGAEKESYFIPQKPFYGCSYTSLTMYDATNSVPETVGSFEQAVTIPDFPDGWKYIPCTGNQGFQIRFTCRNLFLLFKEHKETSMGSAEVYVDGILKGTISGYGLFGWGNPVLKLIFCDDIVKEHMVEIRMAPRDTNKDFVILAFGVCETDGRNEHMA